jgi:uncharacterized protein YcnI
MDKKYVTRFIMVCFVAIAVIASAVVAHVHVEPTEAVAGEQDYIFTVPNEMDVATTGLRLVVPDNVYVTQIENVPGWSYTTKTVTVPEMQTDDGDELPTEKITEIDWSGSLPAGEYQQFGVSTYYGGAEGDLAWKAYQTYADGTVVSWDGTDPEGPAPTVSIVSEQKIDTLTNKVNELSQKVDNAAASGPKGSSLPTWLSIAALALSVIALGASRKRK